MNEWIPVSKKLPPKRSYENCKEYLIWEGRPIIAFYINNQWKSNLSSLAVIYYPTHWMNIPRPSKDD